MLTECMEYNEENIWIMCILIKGYLDQIAEGLNIYLKNIWLFGQVT